jgi:beta-xylosidase
VCECRARRAPCGRRRSRAQGPPPWDSNRSDGTFANPIIHADYSDPDVVRAGPDYYLTASSFSAVPGLPILHSTDLVNWSLVNHALPRLVPEDVFRVPRHGAGVWAPAIRHHAGKYWIYYPDPDFGIYVITATDPRGNWSKPVLVKQGKGLIDPCPLWDDDGRVYLVHAFARSRAGFANVLHVNRMNDDATRVVDEGSVVVDGNQIPGYTTLEGPKFYKRKGWFGGRIGLQWQWQANPSEHWANTPASGGLRLRATSQASNLWTAANLLLQKFPAPAFTADVALDTSDLRSGERAGLIVFGEDYAWAGIEQQGARRMLVVRSVARAQEGGPETVVFSAQHDQPRVTLRVTVTRGAQFRFAIVDRGTIREIGGGFQAKPGRWVGAKVGLFAAAPVDAADEGWASFARFTTTAVR